jgi:hypothetical protein
MKQLTTSRCESDGWRVDLERSPVPAAVASIRSLVLYLRAPSNHSPVLLTGSEAPLVRAPAGLSRPVGEDVIYFPTDLLAGSL